MRFAQVWLAQVGSRLVETGLRVGLAQGGLEVVFWACSFRVV